jgi:hypothetical protein
MKSDQINLRTSSEDRELIKQAAKKLQPGQKQNVSKTIRAAVELVANQVPDLFFINRPAIRDIDKNIEQGRAKLQVVINEFNAVTGKTLTIDELQKFVFDGRSKYMVPNYDYIREQVTTKLIEGKSGEIVGLQLSEAKLRELVVIPDLSLLMEAVKDIGNVSMVMFREMFYWNAYQISDGKVIIIPEQVELIKNQFRCYAETAQERQKLVKVRNLCRILDSFIEDSISPEKLNIAGLCYFDLESGRFEPSEQYIKFGLTPIFKL